MATVYAGLHYGVSVDVYDLVKAGKVFEKVRSQSLPLDILALRLKNGTLDRNVAMGISRCPIDILTMIKDQLFGMIFEEEPHPWIAAHMDVFEPRLIELRLRFENDDSEEEIEAEIETKEMWEYVKSIRLLPTDPDIPDHMLHPSWCKVCKTLWKNPLVSLQSVSPKPEFFVLAHVFSHKCNGLVRSFGLQLPREFPNYWPCPEGGNAIPFDDSIPIFVALPWFKADSLDGSGPDAYVTSSQPQGLLEGITSPTPNQGAVYFDHNSFIFPKDAQERFEKLISTYRIKLSHWEGPLAGFDYEKTWEGFAPMEQEMWEEAKVTPRLTLLYGGEYDRK